MVALAGGIFDEREEEVKERLHYPPPREEIAAVDPEELPTRPSRWTLKRVRATFPWLRGYTLSGIWRLLQRLGLALRQGQPQQYSPDPDYALKEQHLLQTMQQVAQQADQELLFVDE